MAPPSKRIRHGPAAFTWWGETGRWRSRPAWANWIFMRTTWNARFARCWPRVRPMRDCSSAGLRFLGLTLWLVSLAWAQPAPQSAPAVEQVLRHAIELHQAGNVT